MMNDLVELILLNLVPEVRSRPASSWPSWMMPRYMSTMYTVPSGAVRRFTGRNSGSVLRMNSEKGNGFRSCVRPSVLTMSARRISRPTGSA